MYISMDIQERAMDRFSIADARRNLPSLVREAERGKAIELTRRGAPVAILVGRHEFDRLLAKRRGFAKSFEDFARGVELVDLDLDPDVLFGGARAETPGRDVSL